MIRQGKILKQVQGPSRKSYHKQQKVGPWAKLPTAQVSRFTKNLKVADRSCPEYMASKCRDEAVLGSYGILVSSEPWQLHRAK